MRHRAVGAFARHEPPHRTRGFFNPVLLRTSGLNGPLRIEGRTLAESTPGLLLVPARPERSSALVNKANRGGPGCRRLRSSSITSHFRFGISRTSRSFYRRALAPFGVEEVEAWGGMGWG